MPTKPQHLFVLASALSSLVAPALSLDLMQAYKLGLKNDAIFQAAQYEYQAVQQNPNIARAGLLPNVAFNFSYNSNNVDRTTTFTSGSTQDQLRYGSQVAGLALRQPLYNPEGSARYRLAQSQALFASEIFRQRSQELVQRIVGAYLEALLAEDQVRLAQAQTQALLENKNANQRLFEKGQGTKTDVLETQARYEISLAQAIEAEDARTAALRTLAASVGIDPGELQGLGPEPAFIALSPANYEAWEALALENNPEILASQHQIAVAREEVEKNSAGHQPRLDFVASLSQNKSDTVFTYNQQSMVQSAGVQLSLPIYSGGSVSASVEQSVQSLSRAKFESTSTTQRILVDLRKQFNLVLSGQSKVQALSKAAQSAASAVEATQRSMVAGLRINLDLLNAQQQLYTTQRDLAQARYAYLNAYAKLAADAGISNENSVLQMHQVFTATPP